MLRLLGLSVLFVGCTDYVEMQSGDFVSDVSNTPVSLHGVSLHVDLAAARAELRDGSHVVALTLTRVPDREDWRPDCGEMSGHSMLEKALISPQDFTIRGQAHRYHALVVSCSHKDVELRHESDLDTRWRFDRR